MSKIVIDSGYIDRVNVGIIALILMFAGSAVAEDVPPTPAGEEWCGTQRVFEQKYREKYGIAVAPEACPQNGPCDDPEERDTWIPDGSGDFQYVRLIIHNLALDDGSKPFSTPEHIAGQVAQLNADFAQVGIQFIHQINQINSTAWRTLSEAEIGPMKNATAIEPDRYLNVWATIVEFSYSFGTFPWSFDALQPTGGIVMGHFHWVELPNRVFAHEVGHTLGLYHTFRGVDETDQCSSCYESPLSNSSLLGDLCADTPPTPTNQGPCADYGGDDPCSGEPWGYTMPENYMGYATQSCLTTFTPQQGGRLRCWSNSVLDNWADPFQVEASPNLGPVPLTADITAATHKNATGWQWDLDDGFSSQEESPTQTYGVPGLKNVTVDMQTTQGSYSVSFPGLVSAYADTLRIGQGRFQGNVGWVEISVHNYLPLKEIEIPFVYDGSIDIFFDSVSVAGLRTASMSARLISRVNSWNTASVLISTATESYLEPGDGPIAKLYFRLLQPGANGSVPIEITSYPHHELEFVTYAGTYMPVYENGSLEISCCQGTVGDANADNGANATVGDISVLVSHLFITGVPLDCYQEADVNQSGGIDATRDDITIGDVSVLIDHLFISGVPLLDCL